MKEFVVKAETHEGKTVTLRAGFPSRATAERHPVKLSAWKRVWVEDVDAKTAPPGPATLPPKPWSWQTSETAVANGLFHGYIVDATGRKIAAIWGRGDEKRLIAEAILEGVNGPQA